MSLLMGHNHLACPSSASRVRVRGSLASAAVSDGRSESVRDQSPQPARSDPARAQPSLTVLAFNPPDSLWCTRAAPLFTRPRH